MSNPFQHDAMDETKKTLLKLANESKWTEVIKTYKKNPEARTAKITSSGDTALHIAISNGDERFVKDLVAVVSETEGALEMQNEHGNTPLHLAAYLGNANMCRSIARCNSKLMGLRNGDNETPFFLSVRHGRKKAFYALHNICEDEEGYNYCRGKHGETILHSAISGEYFDLAFYIMDRYEKLLNAITEQGFSPLHILANKPSAFRSGSQIRGLDKLIYHCIFVDELQLDNLEAKPNKDLRYKEENPTYPQNYHTCAVAFDLLRHVTWVLLGVDRKSGNQVQKKQQEGDHGEKHDEEKKQVGDCTEKRDEVKQHIVTVLSGSRNAEAERLQYKAPCIKGKGSNNRNAQGHELFPNNYTTFFNIAKLISKTMLVILGLGSKSVEKMREKKTKHIWSLQIMEKLLKHAMHYEYEFNGKTPGIPAPAGKDGAAISYTLSNIAGAAGTDAANLNLSMIDDIDHEQDINPVEKHQPIPPPDQNSTLNKADRDDKKCCREMVCTVLNSLGLVKTNPLLKKLCSEKVEMEMEKKETPILVAARNGVVEIVEGILRLFPVAIHDMNNDNKNVVLLAVEHRQPHVYKFLDDRKIMKETIFRKTDKDGNSALHLAARLGEYRPWLIPGAALQMQWEIKWYEFVKNSMSPHFFQRHNNDSKTARDIFTETHGELVKEGGAWLTNTSQSCSVVAALIATVAFATSATVPGGVKSDNSGTPTLQNKPAFNIFAISSLVALCFSVTSVVMFLAILTSRFQEKDFRKDLPRKLLVGLTSLFISIGSMLLSFCAGHFFVLKEKLQYAAFPMYAITCLPVTFFAFAQFPLYFDLVWATIRKVPQRSSK